MLQKTTEMSIATVVNLIQVFAIWPFMPSKGVAKGLRDDLIYSGDSIWTGWDYFGTIFAFAILFTHHYIAGLVVKNLDTIVKQVASTSSIVWVFFISLWWASINVQTRVIPVVNAFPPNTIGYPFTQTVKLKKNLENISGT